MLLIDNAPLDALVWQVLTLTGHLAPSTPQRATIDRGVAVSAPSSRTTLAPRVLEQTLELRPPSLPDRIATIDAIRARCAGLLELRLSESPDRRWWGFLDSDPVVELVTAPYVNPLCLVTVRFRVLDPRAEAVEPTVIALGATPVAIPLGFSASAPVVALFGASPSVVDPVITIDGPAGVITALRLTATLAAGEALELDAATEQVQRRQTGTVVSALETVTSGSFPVADPETGPLTMRLSATSGTPTGVARYRRLW